ncbi:M4 family metallopeptidase [Kordia sp. YSTF-M3]|uniref:M4 family metallopeptidase n=1 Tax=Kordia aestuariivivens TaxID=2759037 RepID=A0ABR7Q8F3_9FLAO|nr:M4 family metallopeptidase [Kordia aestuariivivens]MBC8754842.1 M4 family metallopeptidase [Kordia aestuariivivens]
METKKKLLAFLKQDPQLKFKYNEQQQTVQYLNGKLATLSKDSKSWEKELWEFANKHADLFGKIDPESTKLINEAKDTEKGTTFTYQQYHEGIKIEGAVVQFNVNKKGKLKRVKNLLQSKIPISAKPKLKADVAFKNIKKVIHNTEGTYDKPALLFHIDKEQTLRLSYLFTLKRERNCSEKEYPMLAEHHGGSHIWKVYVDAHTGAIINYYDNMQTISTVGNGTGVYSGTNTVNAWDDGTTFSLRDTTRTGGLGPVINTNDGSTISVDADNNWNNNTTTPRGANQGAEVDSHIYTSDVIDYFNTVHARNSIDGLGGNVLSVAHFGTNTDNAYWNGTQMLIGDGSGAAPGFDYLCTDDVIAHEFVHGVTQYTCGLIYQNESGALNEAFSDIFAAFITNNWLIGESCWLKTTAPALRNMIEPTNGGLWNVADPINSVINGHQPSHYSQRYIGSADNGGVHINSGIINHLFYLLTIGGTHTISGITVNAIGQNIAETLLYRCMTVNLVGQPNATFLDFRAAMLDACLDLFPTDLNVLTQVKNGFNAVGIGPDLYVRDNISDTGVEPYPGGALWNSPDIINRQNIVSNPAGTLGNMSNANLSQNIERGQDNFVYIRLQNRGAASGDVTINVFLSPATTFGSPALWIPVGSDVQLGIAPGTSRVSNTIVFPAAMIPATGHYCMIAVISDALDPAPDHTLISNLSEYLNYVRNTNNIAYKNMNVVDVLPNLVGNVSVLIERFQSSKDIYDIELDLENFIPGAKLDLKANRKAFKYANFKGLKLDRRLKRKSVLKVLDVGELKENLIFNTMTPATIQTAGIAGDFVKKEVHAIKNIKLVRDAALKLSYKLPSKEVLDKLPKKEYSLVVKQLWEGEVLGAFTVVFRHK